jgi:hypothetical protein
MMEFQDIVSIKLQDPASRNISRTRMNGDFDFKSIIRAHFHATAGDQPAMHSTFSLIPEGYPLETVNNIQPSGTQAALAYEKHSDPTAGMSGWAKYKDDQLLRNPGGDHYYLDQGRVIADPPDQKTFWGRVGKDVSDAVSNVKNFFHNLLFGSKIHYRDKKDQIREGRQRGLAGSMIDFVKDMGSAFTLGLWRSDGEKEPQGILKRIGFCCSKVKEAVFGDLIQGTTGSILHMGKDLLLAGWNLLEAVPDATIGNTKAGRELTTSLFDNGQVAIEYLTDVLPGGDAWVRVHSPGLSHLEDLKAPVVNNMEMPERSPEDERWKYVRNTPFRKAVETIGSLLSDFLTFRFFGDSKYFSSGNHRKKD